MERPPAGMDELVEHWTVLAAERDLISGKRGATRLGFALVLKFYTRYGRFPRGPAELPDEVVEHLPGRFRFRRPTSGSMSGRAARSIIIAGRYATTWTSGSARSPTLRS